MMRSACRVACWGLTALCAAFSASAGHASSPLAALRVRPLRAAGGEGGVERELPARLTTALAHFLRDHADPWLKVETTDRSEQSAETVPAVRYTLESDLSYASGPNEESGRYLLVTRLIRQGRPSALLGQWAGSASSLRYLTANLRGDPRVHTLGLVGEIGSRVLAAVAADADSPTRQWRALWPRLAPLRSPTPMITQAESPYSPLPAIAGGNTFRLRLPFTAGRRYCLLTAVSSRKVEALTLTPAETQSPAGHDAQPLSQAIRLPEGTSEAWLLCRNAASAHTSGRLSRLCTRSAEEDDAPVHILNGVGTGAAAPKENPVPLLEEIARDSNSWRVLRLHVSTPHK